MEECEQFVMNDAQRALFTEDVIKEIKDRVEDRFWYARYEDFIIPVSDYVQDACEACCRASKNFDSEEKSDDVKTASFTTYNYAVIKYYFSKPRNWYQFQSSAGAEEFVVDDYEEICLSDVDEGDAEREFLRRLFDYLPGIELTVLKMSYGFLGDDKRSPRVIARVVGMKGRDVESMLEDVEEEVFRFGKAFTFGGVFGRQKYFKKNDNNYVSDEDQENIIWAIENGRDIVSALGRKVSAYWTFF